MTVSVVYYDPILDDYDGLGWVVCHPGKKKFRYFSLAEVQSLLYETGTPHIILSDGVTRYEAIETLNRSEVP